MLNDNVILITGAGRGIGRGIAQAIAEAGGDTVLLDLDMESVQKTAGLVEGAGRRALPLVADITDEAAVSHAIAHAAQTFGRFDGLVNNAGMVKMDSALDTSTQNWSRHFEVNVQGLFLCCRLAAKQMITQGNGGSVVNIASNAGKVGYPNMAAYNASKAAVINLTRTLSAEWAEYNINVNAVCPGGVDTPMLLDVAEWVTDRIGGSPHELVKTMKPNQMDRRIQPIEVGRVVAFLLSDHATIIRGQSINIDGGDTPY